MVKLKFQYTLPAIQSSVKLSVRSWKKDRSKEGKLLMRRWEKDRPREVKLGLRRMLWKSSSKEPTQATSARNKNKYNNV